MIYSGTGLYSGETMTIRKTFLVSAALLASAARQPALAQASFASGAKVRDTAGGAVGTITSVAGEFVILKKDKQERQEERRVRKECVSTIRYWGWPCHTKKN